MLMGEGYEDLLSETPSHSHSCRTPAYNNLTQTVVVDDFQKIPWAKAQCGKPPTSLGTTSNALYRHSFTWSGHG